ncbi:hypothetical protein T10_5126 [Trichinella papuae]|uniref:Uncharacterized protein n=1 Tax=Trichinella papuae TaxID=268474 RepID=A0A0V1M9L9_9BILA|nr:hypothetical protein T10_5126 [Trichinella papuae]
MVDILFLTTTAFRWNVHLRQQIQKELANSKGNRTSKSTTPGVCTYHTFQEIPNILDNTSASSEQAYQKFLRRRMFDCARMKSGSTGRRLPFDPTSQHLRFRNARIQTKPANRPKHSLAKSDKAILHTGVGKLP